MTHQLTSRKVAVVGGGPSGLVAARELRREGHTVVVLEQGTQLGGLWVYTAEVESDPVGLDPGRTIVHSSLYSSLRTNLPREFMGFRDFPFVATGKVDRDSRRFPGHQEVLRYLEDFGREFRVNELIRYETEVRNVGLDMDGKWRVTSKRKNGDDGNEDDEIYDAVVVCNGRFTEPRVPDIAGIKHWPGKQIHSHNYRTSEPFRNQIVIVIGSGNSGTDICRDIARVAKEVHVASKPKSGVNFGMLAAGYDNLWLHPKVESAHQDGRVTFDDGSMVVANAIVYCTGYNYNFPFLHSCGAISVDDNRVGPLYKHIFPPALAPGLSFVGIPWMDIPFLLRELQSKWIAGILSGRYSLPSQQKMMEDVESFYAKLEAEGVPKRYTHSMGYQFEYDNWVAAQSGSLPVEEWRKRMYHASINRRKNQPETYRDEWDDHDFILQAHHDFLQYLPIPTYK